VRIDGWKSRVSMVIGETHSRCSVWPCSTLALSRAYLMTSNVTGSTSADPVSCSGRSGSMDSEVGGTYPRATPSQATSAGAVMIRLHSRFGGLAGGGSARGLR
jgi:hypothetical protein